MKPTHEPIRPSERMDILDILRGFAIFGILAVNIAGMAGPAFLPGYLPPALPWHDQIATFLVNFLAMGKFYVIFSFLFGLGFSIQMSRAEVKGQSLKSFYPRRLWILFGLGLLHNTFFFLGDILRHYALLGFVLMAFRKRSDRTLMIWAAVFMVIGFITMGITGGPLAVGGEIPEELAFIVPMARDVYTGSSFLQVVIFQAVGGVFSFFITFASQGGVVMALFLLGLLAGRKQFFQQLAEKKPVLKNVAVWGFIFGLSFNGAFILFAELPWVSTFFWVVGAPLLGSVYMAWLCLLYLKPRGAKWLAPVGRVGRMALTNYLMHSLIGSLIFNGYGLGFYEKVGPAGLLGITFLIYLLQIPFSTWWLNRYQFGPMEWLWRSLTYKKRQPFKKVFPVTAGSSGLMEQGS
ncbi:DUF418 domain-containing protein [Anoxynatronum buryatiense]|uniref:DUF418 domain-containing protein n=1 Tax=Anoxynatronum buryatiense TaxID=489973 RepID=A0AA45WXA5_9CLOT|nr:DUF418 domain-containing protein [Anoxynatronum buryatiense]SMP63511.1 uncharacterized protein SAMN06296020_11137 [Anoxynatronum buryatiense]